jgi:hypothetical protein
LEIKRVLYLSGKTKQQDFYQEVLMNVGSIVQLKISCLNNKPGTIGVCYETYNLGRCYNLGTPGCSIIFENGSYDGFSADEQKEFLTHVSDSDLVYKFTNVMKLAEDFRKGLFARYLNQRS